MRVLLLTDGSTDAKAATEWLRQFPLPRGSTLTAMSVSSMRRAPIGVPATTVREFLEAARAHARGVAEEARDRLRARWPEARARVAEGDAMGDPRRAIVAAVRTADLTVVGARGLGAVAGFLLGSVSLAVARQARGAVLVAKGAPRRIRTVLVAIDGSADALHAARYLASLGDLDTLRVRLLAVQEMPATPMATRPGAALWLEPALSDARRARKAELERALREAAAVFKGEARQVRTTVVAGFAAEQVVRAAARGCDLVVLGARGLGRFQRMLLGSVSERVLRHAACPVLVVKAARSRR
jgi:nucleotide-binding universal stress UspA family protein